MKRWMVMACASVGASLAALIGYKLYSTYARKKRTPTKCELIKKSLEDIEDVLDDDVLEDGEGPEGHQSGNEWIDSDDEFDSDDANETAASIGVEKVKRTAKVVHGPDRERLKGLAKKIRANRKKLTANDAAANELLQSWLHEGNEQTANRKGWDRKGHSGTPAENLPKVKKDDVFYGLFACYTEASYPTKSQV